MSYWLSYKSINIIIFLLPTYYTQKIRIKKETLKSLLKWRECKRYDKQIQDKARVLLARHRRISAVCFLWQVCHKQTGYALGSLAQLAKLAHPRSIIQN